MTHTGCLFERSKLDRIFLWLLFPVSCIHDDRISIMAMIESNIATFACACKFMHTWLENLASRISAKRNKCQKTFSIFQFSYKNFIPSVFYCICWSRIWITTKGPLWIDVKCILIVFEQTFKILDSSQLGCLETYEPIELYFFFICLEIDRFIENASIADFAITAR